MLSWPSDNDDHRQWALPFNRHTPPLRSDNYNIILRGLFCEFLEDPFSIFGPIVAILWDIFYSKADSRGVKQPFPESISIDPREFDCPNEGQNKL